MIGSSPVVGSSKNRISGSAAIARASATRFCMPPDSSAGRNGATSAPSPTAASFCIAMSCACDRAMPRPWIRPNATFSQTLKRIEQRAALEQHAEFAYQPVAGGAAQPDSLDPVDPDRAGIGPEQADDALDQHRFAGAGAADDDETLAGAAGDIDAVEHGLAPERLAQP